MFRIFKHVTGRDITPNELFVYEAMQDDFIQSFAPIFNDPMFQKTVLRGGEISQDELHESVLTKAYTDTEKLTSDALNLTVENYEEVVEWLNELRYENEPIQCLLDMLETDYGHLRGSGHLGFTEKDLSDFDT